MGRRNYSNRKPEVAPGVQTGVEKRAGKYGEDNVKPLVPMSARAVTEALGDYNIRMDKSPNGQWIITDELTALDGRPPYTIELEQARSLLQRLDQNEREEDDERRNR